MSIRLRVTLATVLIAAFGLAAADGATFFLLRRYVGDNAAGSVYQVAQTAVDSLRGGQRLTLPTFAGSDRPVLVEFRNRRGRVLQRVATSEAVGLQLPSDLLSRPGRARQIEAPHRHGPAFEVVAVAAPGGTVVAVVSLSNEANTLSHLFHLNIIVGLIVLALLAVVAAAVLTLSLRPLRRIAVTADAIVAGDLGARVPAAPRRSEISRVATGLNRMLDENEAAFAQRDATESRLRQFLADASHELRTPLTSIRGYAELFRRGADRNPDDLAKAMRAIEDEASRMSALIEDLLLLARLDETGPITYGPVILDDLVEAAVESARVVEPARLFQFEFSDRPIVVEGDEGGLRQVLDNLLANIRRHTPADAAAYLSLRSEGAEVVLTVEDTGPGIPTAERERVFDRFFRPDGPRDRRRGGAGLGLAIVRSIVTAHGGTIDLQQAHPHGAVFVIRLPIVAADDSRGTPS